MTEKSRTRLVCALIIVAVGLMVYANSFRGAFIYDDVKSIVNNPNIRQLWPPWGILGGPRPVVNLSLAVNYAIGKLDIRGYHLFNLAVHVLAALTLFGIVRRTLQIAAFDFAQARDCSLRLRSGQGMRIADSRTDGPENRGTSNLQSSIVNPHSAIALAIALIWLVHPLQTESVTYIIQRSESLMALFYLATLYFAIRSFSSPRPRRWQAACVVACALGMGCKPVMVSAPLMVFIYDLLFAKYSIQNPKPKIQNRLPFYAFLAATWLILAVLLARSPAGASAGFGMSKVTPWQYALTQFGVVAYYLRLSFWPHPLCLDYGWPIAKGLTEVLLPATLIVFLLGLILWLLWRKSAAAFLGVWFLLILAPTSSIMPIADPCVEHRMYLPLAAVVTLGVLAAYWAGRRVLRIAEFADDTQAVAGGAAGMTAVLLVVGVFGVLTHLRNEDYRSSAAIWADVVRQRPNNRRGHIFLADALLAEGRLAEAEAHYNQALRVNSLDEYAYLGLGAIHLQQGRIETAIEDFTQAVGRKTDAQAEFTLAMLLSRKGELDSAMKHFREALRIKADYAPAHCGLGNILAAQGRLDEAATQYEDALRLKPDYAEAHNNLGNVLRLQGRTKEATAQYREVARLRPDWPEALVNLSWLLATQPEARFRNGAEAVRLAQRACELTRDQDAPCLDTLAAAYAEAGRFAEAAQAARKALDVASRKREEKLAADIRRRLALYESGRAFHEAGPDAH